MTHNEKMDIRNDFYQLLDRHCQCVSHREFCNTITELANEEKSKGFIAELKELHDDHFAPVDAVVDLERGSSD